MRSLPARLIFGAAALASALLAQNTAPVALTLVQAEAIALKNHPQIAAAQNLAAAAGERVVESKSAYYPTINGEITGAQSANQQDRVGAGALSASRLFNRQGDGLQLQQLVTDLGRTKNLVANSKFQAQAANQNTQATRFDIILGVNQAYFEVLQAKSVVKVAEDTVKARQLLADQVTALAKSQLKSQVDVSFAEVNVSEAKLMLIRAQDAVKRAYADLGRALGEDLPIQYDLAETNHAPPPAPAPEPLIGEAIQNRPELSGLRLRLEAAKKFETAEKDLSRPTVSVIAVGGALPYLNQDPRLAPNSYEGVALNVDIPIFNGHLFSARRNAAHYETLATDQHLRDLQQQVEHDVRSAWITSSTAYQRIPVTEQLLNQAQAALDLAQGRYNLGLSSIVEITQAQLNLTQAQIENVNARYEYQGAFAALQYTIGALK
jgi:outer membrane protein